MSVKLRYLELQDEIFYQSLYQNPAAMEFISEPLSHYSSSQSFQRLLKRGVNDSGCHTFIIKFEYKPAGIIQAKKQNTAWSIGIIIEPRFWGKGIAKAAHHLLFERMQLLDCERCFAVCQKHNKAANTLYQKLGFELQNPKSEQDADTYTWELN